MDDPHDPDRPGLIHWIREHFVVMMGVVGLFAWFALVWLMFGDVL